VKNFKSLLKLFVVNSNGVCVITCLHSTQVSKTLIKTLVNQRKATADTVSGVVWCSYCLKIEDFNFRLNMPVSCIKVNYVFSRIDLWAV